MSRTKNLEFYNELITYINEYQEEYSRSPSLREIAFKFNKAPSTIQEHINYLRENNMLIKTDGVRNYQIAKSSNKVAQIPLVGTITCGPLSFAEQNIDEYIPISRGLIGYGDVFALKAKGDSMINAGINDGDIVFVKKQNYASDGQIVVALVENETTLKRFYRDEKNKRYILHPENDRMKDIIVDNIVIQGIAIKVIKSL